MRVARSLPSPPGGRPGSPSGAGDTGDTDDTGDPDPGVVAALTAYSQDPRLRPQAVAAVQASRLLVPVVAVLGEVEYDAQGRPHDKTSEMASVLLTSSDGRLALLAFTGLPALRAWNPDARPVPVPARVAAQSAVQEGAAALLVDVAGPVRLVVDGVDLEGVARGWSLVRVGADLAWVRPADSAGES